MPIMLLGILCLAIVVLGGLRRFRGPYHGYLELNPQHAKWLRSLGLTRLEDFFRLSGVIVGGHPDRHVRRISFEEGKNTTRVYLKQEHRVPWRVRWSSWWAGLGWASRSLREARVLQALEREGFAAPTWLAVGESPDGRAFLLLLEVPQARDLRSVLPAVTAARRLHHLIQLGRLLARLHTCGIIHPDLHAGHVLVEGTTKRLVFIDWARCQRRAEIAPAERARALATLDVTVPPGEVSDYERMLVLQAYLHAAGPEVSAADQLRFTQEVERYRNQLLQRRHLLEKRRPKCPERPQTWEPIPGTHLEVSAHLAEVVPGNADWLLRYSQEPAQSRWLATDAGDPLRLERNLRSRSLVARLLAWMTGHELASPELKQAHLLLRLERYQVPTAAVLAKGERRVAGAVESLLLVRPVSGTLALHHWLRRCNDAGMRQAVLMQAGEVLRNLHDSGCYLGHADAWQQVSVDVRAEKPRVVLEQVDGLCVRRRLEPHQARTDLDRCQALLDSQGCSEGERATFVRGYAGQTDPPNVPAVVHQSPWGEGTMSSEPAQLLPAQDQRTSLWQRLCRGASRLWQQTRWPRFVGSDWVRSIMAIPVTDNYSAKQGRSSGRVILPPQTDAGGEAGSAEPLRIYLKRHYRLPWWDALRAILWPKGRWSPAVQEMHHLEKARRLGVPVPEVIAAGEFIGPGLRLQSFLAVRELTDMLPLHLAIPLAAQRLSPEAFAQWKRGLITEMARLCRLLHDRNWFHKDLYLCHFYIPESFTHAEPAEWRNQVFMIDLHRLAHHPLTWPVWQMKDLAQLMYSSEVEGVTDRDRLAFWRAYQGSAPRTGWDRWLRWAVILKWKRYRSHNQKNAKRRKATTTQGS